jgi:hypothetical protein
MHQAVRTTADSALDDRRLVLRLSEDGYIVEVSASPASLFGFEPGQVLGKTIASCVDIFHLLEEDGGDVRPSCGLRGVISSLPFPTANSGCALDAPACLRTFCL